jgi:4-amino-4-deoxy-L-arabinose transferase-like glycosyltransferase
MTQERTKIGVPRPVVLILLALILILSYRFRTYRLDYTPGWFRDEGTYLEVSRRIGNGQLQLGAVNITFVGPNMTHPPLYFALTSLFMKATHTDMHFFRLSNALLGVLATLLIFFLGYEAGRYGEPLAPPGAHAELLGLLTAFFYAIHSDAVMYNRMGFPYNLYLVEGILLMLFALRYLRKRDFFWCLATCVVAGAALLTVYYSIVFIPFLFLIILMRKKPRHFWALVCIPIPLIIFLYFMASSGTHGFWEDLTALRKASKAGSLYVTLYHYHDFFETGITYFVGLAGLLLLRRKSAGVYLFILYLLMIHIVLRKEDTIIRFVHYPVIPILPLVALGCAALTLFSLGQLITSRPAAGLLLIPILLASYLSINQVRHGIHGRFYSSLEFGMTKNTNDTWDVASYLQRKVNPTDLVLSNTTLWSLLPCRYADLSQSLAFNGEMVDFYRHPFPRERFLFSPALEGAAYVVMDSFTDQWKFSAPGTLNFPLRELVDKVEQTWQLVYEKGEYRVYKNPAILTK